MAKKKSKTNQKESKKNAGASQEPDPPLTSSGYIGFSETVAFTFFDYFFDFRLKMFPLNLSLAQGQGPGFLRPEDGHGRGNMFSIGSQFNSQLHRRHISLHQFVLEFENTREVLVKLQHVPSMLITIRRNATNQLSMCGYFHGWCY
ncbi:Uncharacterized protein Rs2_21580 [Raphanus sativus]|nr:Uncharacterized protein Rs2_21580 [Raphanus sativus]